MIANSRSVGSLPGLRESRSFSTRPSFLLLVLIFLFQPLGVLVPYITYRLHLRFPGRGFDKVCTFRSFSDKPFLDFFPLPLTLRPSLSLQVVFPIICSGATLIPQLFVSPPPFLLSSRSPKADLVASGFPSVLPSFSDHQTSSSPPSSSPSSSTSTSLVDLLAGSKPIPSLSRPLSTQRLPFRRWRSTYFSPPCLVLRSRRGGGIRLGIQSIVRLSSSL